jgi:hypothetical protein
MTFVIHITVIFFDYFTICIVIPAMVEFWIVLQVRRILVMRLPEWGACNLTLSLPGMFELNILTLLTGNISCISMQCNSKQEPTKHRSSIFVQ